MKKILFLSSLAIAAAFTVSCNKENNEGNGITTDGESVLFPAPSVISASSVSTKTTLDGTSILWAEGDAITLFAENGTPISYFLTTGAGTKSAEFAADPAPTGNVLGYALYPAVDADAPLKDNKVRIFVGVDPWYVSGGYFGQYPMAAKSEDGENFLFENLATILRLSMTGDATVETVTIKALGENVGIVGAADVDFSGEIPVLKAASEGASNTVTMNCHSETLTETATDFNFILIPGEYDGFEITVTDVNGHETVRTTGAVELKAGSIKTFESPLDIYSTPQGWNLTGSNYGWGESWVDLYETRGLYSCKNVNMAANEEFKILWSDDWSNQAFGASELTINKGVGLTNGAANLKIAEDGIYDIYFDQMTKYIFVMEQGKTPAFGLVGSINGNAWNIENPVAMTMENDGYFVAKGVSPDQANAIFKIVVDGSYNNAYNIGCDTPLEIGQPVTGTKGTSNNFTIPNATTEVTYDIWFDLGTLQVWVMPEGQVPGQSAE